MHTIAYIIMCTKKNVRFTRTYLFFFFNTIHNVTIRAFIDDACVCIAQGLLCS